MECPARSRPELFLNVTIVARVVGVSRWALQRRALKGEIRFRTSPTGRVEISVDDALHLAAARTLRPDARGRMFRVDPADGAADDSAEHAS